VILLKMNRIKHLEENLLSLLKLKVTFVLFTICLFLMSCSGSDDQETAQATATPSPSPTPSPTPTDIGKSFELSDGIVMEIASDGTGQLPAAGDRVHFNYEIKSSNGDVLDAQMSSDQPMSIQLGEHENWGVWQEALLNLKVGSSATLTVPSESLVDFGVETDQDFMNMTLIRVAEPEL